MLSLSSMMKSQGIPKCLPSLPKLAPIRASLKEVLDGSQYRERFPSMESLKSTGFMVCFLLRHGKCVVHWLAQFIKDRCLIGKQASAPAWPQAPRGTTASSFSSEMGSLLSVQGGRALEQQLRLERSWQGCLGPTQRGQECLAFSWKG